MDVESFETYGIRTMLNSINNKYRFYEGELGRDGRIQNQKPCIQRIRKSDLFKNEKKTGRFLKKTQHGTEDFGQYIGR